MHQDDIKQVTVVGLGTMGPGLALSFAQAGYKVIGYDPDEKAPDRTRQVVKSNLGALVEFEELTADQARQAEANITYQSSLTKAIESAQLIVEAAPEDRQIKKEIYLQVARQAPPDCQVWSNTSTLNIYELLPDELVSRAIIAHWFAPPHILPLVEVVKGPQTPQETADLAMNLLQKLNKIPVLMEKFVPGFAVNRIQRIINREVFYLIDNHYITPENLDLAVKASLAPRMMLLGLIQRMDFTGLDLSARNLTDPAFYDPPPNNHPDSLVTRVDAGQLGVKTGKGFFDYTDKPLPELLRNRDRYLLRILQSVRFCLEGDRLL